MLQYFRDTTDSKKRQRWDIKIVTNYYPDRKLRLPARALSSVFHQHCGCSIELGLKRLRAAAVTIAAM